MNLRSFNLFRDYSNPLSLRNVGEFLRNNSKQTQVIMKICMFISFLAPLRASSFACFASKISAISYSSNPSFFLPFEIN